MPLLNPASRRIIIALGGLTLLIPGLIVLTIPADFAEGNGIDLGDNASLFNDYRSLGGVLVGTGLLTLLGVVRRHLEFTSTSVAAVAFSSLALGRTYSIIVDGQPSSRLMTVTVIEGVLAALAILVLLTYTEHRAR
jgi:hypothetical protein